MIANLLADRFGHRNAGIALLSFAAITLSIAVGVGWSAVQRWRAASALAEWRDRTMAGDLQAARNSGTEAAGFRPRSAAAGLAAIDPGTAEGGQNLDILAIRCEARVRPAVETAVALSQALRKQAPGSTPERVDGDLARAIVALELDQDAVWPPATAGAPDAALARAAAQRFARAAWRRGDAEAIRRDFGRFLLLCPRHAEARRAALLLAAIDPTCVPERLRWFTSNLTTPEQAMPLLRAALRLAPDRAATIAKAMPANLRRPEDDRALILEPGQTIEALVDRASAAEPAVAEQIAWRCVDAGRSDLAAKVAERVPEPARREVLRAIATARGDLIALAKLEPDRADLRPRISEPRPVEGKIAFHLATQNGMVPIAPPTVMFGDRPLPAELIRRWDSLVVLPRPETPVVAEVRVGDTLVWSGRLLP